MRLVDARLRPSVTVDSKSVESYYSEELLPQLRQSGGQDVPLAEVTPKIKELLTQQKINQLLTAWLQDLRSGSAIRAEGRRDPKAEPMIETGAKPGRRRIWKFLLLLGLAGAVMLAGMGW